MAFGGRELRLFLSIESYGVTNIRNLKRDLAGLQTMTDVVNKRQATLQARQMRQAAAVQKSWNRVLAAPGQKKLLERQEIGLQSQFRAQEARFLQAQKMLGKEGLSDVDAKMWAARMQSADLAMTKINKDLNEMPTRFRTLNREIVQNKNAWRTLADAEYATRQELGKMDEALRIAGLQDQALRMERIGRQVAHFGRLMQFAGLIITAGFGMAAGSFANFSNEASLAGTQMRDLGAPISQAVERAGLLRDEIMGLMMEFPATADEMSQAAYEIYSSMNIVKNGVVDVEAGFKLLEIANKAAVAGGTDLAEATNTMITVLNNFDPELRHVGRTLNEVFAIVRFGRMHLNDFGEAMTKIAPIAKTTGITLKDAGAAFATLSIMFQDTQNAAAGLGRAMEIFTLPQVQKGLQAWGVNITDAHHRLLPLYDIIGKLIKRFPELATGQKSAVQTLMEITRGSEMTKVGIQGTIQARRAIAALATNYALYGDILGNVTNSKKEFDAAFAARIKDPGVQWQIMLNTFRALVLVIGQAVLPVFLKVGEYITDFIDWFRQLNPTIRESVLQFGALAGIFLLIGGTVLNIYGSLIALRANLFLLTKAGGAVGASLSAAMIVVRTFALMGIGVLIAQVFGLQKAIVIMTTAWLVWKTRAIQAIGSVVAAIVTGSAIAGAAIRTAMIRTGILAVVVAAGFAADWIITHWDKVRAFFIAAAAAIRATWEDLMLRALPGITMIGVGYMLQALSPLQTGLAKLVSVIPGVGDALSNIIQPAQILVREGKDLLASGAKDFGEIFTKAYNDAMKRFAKDRKKDKSSFERFMKDLKEAQRKFVSEDFLKQQQAFLDSIGGGEDGKRLAKERTQAIAQAHENMEQKIGNAVDSLINMYERLRQENARALAAFQGPVMQGIFGNIFSSINDTLRQFGIQIPVPFEILQRDMEMQLDYFKRWQAALAGLAKRGAPPELINQIREMGPEAGIPIAEGLLSGGKKGWRDLIKTWKAGQKILDKVTEKQLDDQLAQWQKHGKDAAWAMVNGIGSSLQSAELRDKYSAYIRNTFGAILRKEMADEVAATMKNVTEQIAASGSDISNAIADAITAGAGGGGGGGGGGAGAPTIKQQIQSINQQQAAIKKSITAWQKSPVPGQEKAIRQARQRWATLEGREQLLVNQRAINATKRRLAISEKREAELVAHQRAWAKSGKMPSPGQKAQLIQEAFQIGKLRHEQERLRKAMRAQETRRQALQSIQAQLRAGRERGERRIQVTYHGDSITVNASGATPQAVLRALRKRDFRQKHKKRPGPG